MNCKLNVDKINYTLYVKRRETINILATTSFDRTSVIHAPQTSARTSQKTSADVRD